MKIFSRLITINLKVLKSVRLNKALSRPIRPPSDSYKLSDCVKKLSKAKRLDDAIALTLLNHRVQSTASWNDLIKAASKSDKERSEPCGCRRACEQLK